MEVYNDGTDNVVEIGYSGENSNTQPTKLLIVSSVNRMPVFEWFFVYNDSTGDGVEIGYSGENSITQPTKLLIVSSVNQMPVFE